MQTYLPLSRNANAISIATKINPLEVLCVKMGESYGIERKIAGRHIEYVTIPQGECPSPKMLANSVADLHFFFQVLKYLQILTGRASLIHIQNAPMNVSFEHHSCLQEVSDLGCSTSLSIYEHNMVKESKKKHGPLSGQKLTGGIRWCTGASITFTVFY